MIYNATLFHNELVAEGLQIHGCDSTGHIDWCFPPTPEQLAIADRVKRAHDPNRVENERRQLCVWARDIRDRWANLTASERLQVQRRVFERLFAEELK